MVTHSGRAKVNLSVRCHVLVKMYGKNPRKLFVKIIKKSEVRIKEISVYSFPILRTSFISWCSSCGLDDAVIEYCFVEEIRLFLSPTERSTLQGTT